MDKLIAFLKEKNILIYFLVVNFVQFFCHENPGSGGSALTKMLDPDPQ
jgi:hypothetical protein